jgi:hypothetical protein
MILAMATSRSFGGSFPSRTSAIAATSRTFRRSTWSIRGRATFAFFAFSLRKARIRSLNSSRSKAPLLSKSNFVNSARTSSSVISRNGSF